MPLHSPRLRAAEAYSHLIRSREDPAQIQASQNSEYTCPISRLAPAPMGEAMAQDKTDHARIVVQRIHAGLIAERASSVTRQVTKTQKQNV